MASVRCSNARSPWAPANAKCGYFCSLQDWVGAVSLTHSLAMHVRQFRAAPASGAGHRAAPAGGAAKSFLFMIEALKYRFYHRIDLKQQNPRDTAPLRLKNV